MAVHPSPRIAACFADLVDPRVERTKRHRLLDIITIALCGVICGAESWVEIEDWGDAKLEWLRTWLDLPNGIPSHDTFGRVCNCRFTSGRSAGIKVLHRRCLDPCLRFTPARAP